MIRFCFYFNMETEIQIIDYYFHVKIDFYFEFLMLSLAFYFHKKWKTKNNSFFIFHFHEGIEKRITLNKSRLTLWLFSEVWSRRYSKENSRQVPEIFRCTTVTRKPKLRCLERKQLMYFNVYISGCYFHISFILIVNCDIKYIGRSRWYEVFS